MDVKTLIKAFCERLGIELEADTEGVFAFQVDAFEFAVHDLSEQGRVALVGDLGALPEVNPEGLFRLMLESQHCFRETEGAVFSIDGERERLILNRMLFCAELDCDTFFNGVERFVNQLETWSCIVRDYNGKMEQGKGSLDDVETSESALGIYHKMV